MVDVKRFVPRLTRKSQLGLGAAALVAVGALGGAGAVAATRPSVEMAPRVATPIASLPNTSGVVTVKGRVTEVYGDRFVIADGSGKTMVAAGREGRGAVAKGQPVLVQGRYDDGQLRASYLVDTAGRVEAVGPGGRPPHRGDDRSPESRGSDGPEARGGPDGRGRPDPRGPGGPAGPNAGMVPPPPPGCAAGTSAGMAPPPPPPPNVNGQQATAPVAGQLAPPATATAPAATRR